MRKPRPTPRQEEILAAWASGERNKEKIAEANDSAVAFCPDCGVPVWLSRMADYGKGAEDDEKLYVAAWEMASNIGRGGWFECETCFGK